MYHNIQIIGRLGRNPEMRYTPDGKPVTSFSVAVDDGFGENKTTIWFKVSVWEKQAESANTYLTKGSLVFVEGRLQHDNGSPRVWDKDGKHGASFEITAKNIKFLSPKSQEQGESTAQQEEIPY